MNKQFSKIEIASKYMRDFSTILAQNEIKSKLCLIQVRPMSPELKCFIKKTGMRRKKETFYTLIGVQSSESNVKTTVEVTQPPKNRYRQSTVYQYIMHNPNTCVSMTATAPFTTAKMPDQDRCLSVDEWIRRRGVLQSGG